MKNSVFIIAEAGVNHNGDINLAKKMIDEAQKIGVDAVKFQTFKAESLVCKNAPKAEYQNILTDKKESQYDMIKKLELSDSDHYLLNDYCKKKKIQFLSSPFDIESIDLLDKIGLNIYKIPSGEITNLPYLRKIGGLKKEVILSTGMSDLGEIEDALDVLIKSGTLKENIILLHCNTEYPTPCEDVNLNALLTIKNAFDINVGYSDHTNGIEISLAAVAIGASVIEKHFTLNKNMEGPDHKASLDPDEFKLLVKSIRNIEKSFGDGIKRPSKSELKNINIARKSIVASADIEKNDIFTEKNITIKRPGFGLSPMLWDFVLGKKAKKIFNKDDIIEL